MEVLGVDILRLIQKMGIPTPHPFTPHPHLLPMQALADPECYHEFCRLLMRLKSNYQLVELMRLDDYPQLIELVAKFTVSSLQVRGGRGGCVEGRRVYGGG